MTYEEVETLMGFLRGAFPMMKEEQAETYAAMLALEDDTEAVSKAILDGVNEWKFPPTWAEIKERVRVKRKGAIPRDPAPPQAQPTVEDLMIPSWVKQWTYARFVRGEPDLRPFRESYPEDVRRGNEPVGGWMPTDLYEEEAKLVTDEKVRAVIRAGTPILDLLGPTPNI